MRSWRWVGLNVVLAVHDRQLAEHGGLDGIRDRDSLESALARAQNKNTYGEPDAADLAAAYAFGLVRNHGFADGNKRTAWVVARLFLADNGYRLKFDRVEAIKTVDSLAAGTLEEASLARWFREHLVP